nr:MarR family transcriptional regulator [Paenibacillus shirakamiensis]
METFYRFKNKLYDKQYKKRNDKLNNTKCRMLMIIYRQHKSMVVHISRQLSLSSGATTIMLNQLEADGYIIRVRSEEDRRIVWLSLTEEGALLAKRIIDFRYRFTGDMLGLLSDDEQEDFLRLLRKIETRMEERISSDTFDDNVYTNS